MFLSLAYIKKIMTPRCNGCTGAEDEYLDKAETNSAHKNLITQNTVYLIWACPPTGQMVHSNDSRRLNFES